MSSEADALKSPVPAELWKDWNETAMSMWPGLLVYGKESPWASFDPYNFWMKRAGVVQGQWRTNLTNPVDAWNRWIDAAFNVWGAAIEVSTSVAGAFYQVNEEFFQHLRPPTRSDIGRLEKLVISLEERVYATEDAFVHLEDSYLRVITDQIVVALAESLNRVEGKLDTLDALSTSTPQRTDMLEDLAGRLERVEGKLTTLLEALEKIETRTSPKAIMPGDGSETPHDKANEA